MNYVALGDSITAGQMASAPQNAYPSRIVSLLQTRGTRSFANVLAQPGWSSQALLTAVQTNAMVPLRQANVITIWVGGDDLANAGLSLLRGGNSSIVQRSLAQYAQNTVQLVQTIRQVSKASIILCSQYNPFPNTPLATQAIQALNGVTAEIAGRLGIALAPVHLLFEGRQQQLLYGYRTGRMEDALRSPILPIHPNDAGHLVIAKGLASLFPRLLR